MPIVIFLYFFANIGYFAVLSKETIIGTQSVGVAFGKSLYGSFGSIFITLCVMISTFGTANASIYSSARVTFVAASQNFLPFSNFLEKLHPEHYTPANAIFFQCVLTTIYILTGTFNGLIILYSWTVWIFYGLCAVGLIVLRNREPVSRYLT